MSMYRQLWLSLIASMVFAWIGTSLLSVHVARTFIEQHLNTENRHLANSLALFTSQQNPDATTIELDVSALFDGGQYESIVVRDPNGKTMVEKFTAPRERDVPQWFVRMVDIQPASGVAQINSGWIQLGVVTVVGTTEGVYELLWSNTKKVFGTMFAACFFAGFLVSLVMRRLRRPLQAVVEQASAIADRRFVTIPLPGVPELRQLAIAMNFAVSRLQAIFEEEAARLEDLRHVARCDALTGLANRDFFMSELGIALEEQGRTAGIVMLVRVPDLLAINRSLGRYVTDDLLCRFGRALTEELAKHDQGMAARLNGADFAMLLPLETDASAVAISLHETIAQVTRAFFTDQAAAYIAFARLPVGLDAPEVMMQLASAMVLAETAGGDNLREATLGANLPLPANVQEWAEQMRLALAEKWTKLELFPVANFTGQVLHCDSPLRLKFKEFGEWVQAGHFIAIAERLNLTQDLDRVAIALGLNALKKDQQLVGLAVNLSAASISVPQFRQSLIAQLRQHPAEAKRLWLEVPEAGALKHPDELRRLCQELEATHCKVGLEHFGRQLNQIGHIHDIGLDYIKVDSSAIRGIDSNADNQSFLKGVCSIGRNIGLMIIAEGVRTKAEFDTLKDLGFDGATGPWIKFPEPPQPTE